MYDKIKAFIKKYKYYIVTFGGVITSIISVNYFRNRTIKRNLQRVDSQLSASERLINEQQVTNKGLAAELSKSRNNLSELKSKFEDTKRTSRELELINSEIIYESRRLEGVLSDFKKFIDENSVRE